MVSLVRYFISFPGLSACFLFCIADQFICLIRVEFDDVHRLGDGQSKHSLEAFYAGSLWKVGN